MSDEIKVSVCSWGPSRPLALRWTDPITGKRKAESSGTYDEAEAERAAGELERKLRAGIVKPGKITWKAFRERFREEKLSGMPETTQVAYNVALDHVGRVLDPDRLSKLTAQAVSAFVGRLRKAGMKPTTIARHLRHVKAALRWAARQGYLAQAPVVDMPKSPGTMKGRPITGEEYDRLVGAVPKVRENDPEPWLRLIRGLWLSGLRISEAVALDWTDGPFQIDTTGRHPVFRIQGAGQKSGRAEICPMTPDFAEWILAETPEAERHGPVFPLTDHRDGRHGRRIGDKEAGRVVSAIGEKAGVVVQRTEGKPDPKTGKRREQVKYASAHDLRRSFGTRWARKVMPAVLQRLMRHANIQTTMSYYVSLDADEVAAELWDKHGANGNTGKSGNTCGNTRRKRTHAKQKRN